MNNSKQKDIVVIGGGPAGMAAALEAYKNGIKDVLIIEREREPGGILQQCIHTGFGLHIFNEELTGPEYAERYIEIIKKTNIQFLSDTMVLNISPDKTITAVNSKDGIIIIRAKAVILAMGCREKTRGALNIPGTRPSGIFTAGTAQRFVNIEGYLPGKRIIVLGSGDIGLIMARRMTLEGAQVIMVCEIMPYSGGLIRNIVQCLEDFNIPLEFNCTITEIHGKERLTGVTISKVDNNLKPIAESSKFIDCDTLLLSVGLIPENELSRDAGLEINPVTLGPTVDENLETSVKGIFACGNVLHVNDLVDNVTKEGILAGKAASQFCIGENNSKTFLFSGSVFTGNTMQKYHTDEIKANDIKANDTKANDTKANDTKANDTKANEIKANDIIANDITTNMRSIKKDNTSTLSKTMVCVVCPTGCNMEIRKNGDGVVEVTGNKCKRGHKYAIDEITDPARILTTTVKIKGALLPLLPVKTDKPVAKSKFPACMKVINGLELSAPVRLGEIIVHNIMNTGANVVATRSLLETVQLEAANRLTVE